MAICGFHYIAAAGNLFPCGAVCIHCITVLAPITGDAADDDDD